MISNVGNARLFEIVSVFENAYSSLAIFGMKHPYLRCAQCHLRDYRMLYQENLPVLKLYQLLNSVLVITVPPTRREAQARMSYTVLGDKSINL